MDGSYSPKVAVFIVSYADDIHFMKEIFFSRWRFVFHGGIDGYIRAIVFLGVSDNNRANTVLQLFRAAVDQWGIPSRVRYVE